MRRLRRIIPALAMLLAASLPLTGCAAMLERTWSGSETHIDYPVVEDDSTLRVENYQSLVNALLYYVTEHSYAGTVRLYNYSGEVEDDLERAKAQVTERDPLSAWAVRELSYTVTRILTYYEVEVRISYAHTAGEMAAVRAVYGLSGLSAELERLAEERESGAALLVSGFPGDSSLVEELFRLAWYGDPARSDPEPPEVQAAFYPKEGSRRIAEITLLWGDAPEDGEDYAARLEASATGLLAASPPAGEGYTLEELAALLRSSALYEDEGSDLALAAFTGEPVSGRGLILAMEFLCRRAGIEALPVAGWGDVLWLIVAAPEGYRHLPAQGLIPSAGPAGPEPGGEPAPLLFSDAGMEALGYRWSRELYPVCPEPEPAPTEPAETENP